MLPCEDRNQFTKCKCKVEAIGTIIAQTDATGDAFDFDADGYNDLRLVCPTALWVGAACPSIPWL